MILEEGKRYVTKDGRVTAPLEKSNDRDVYIWDAGVPGSEGLQCWTADGHYWQHKEESVYDLVSVYSERKDVGPRVTQERVDSLIKSYQFHVFPGTTLTVCCITLENGYQVTGESACVSAENFDKQLGETLAHKDARRKIWDLEGYLMRDKLHQVGL